MPATRQLDESPSAASANPSAWLPGVAHEDERRAARAEVERQEAEAREHAGEREGEEGVVRVER